MTSYPQNSSIDVLPASWDILEDKIPGNLGQYL